MPRPSILPKNERNGFYIEVKNKGKATGMKLRSETMEAMLENAKLNKLYKDVTILGEFKDGKWLSAPKPA